MLVGAKSVIPSWVLVDRAVRARFLPIMCKWLYKATFFCYLPLWRRLRDIGNLSTIHRFGCRTELNVIWMSHYLIPDLKSDCLPQVFHFLLSKVYRRIRELTEKGLLFCYVFVMY